MPLAGPALDGPIDLPRILQRGLETRPDAPALVSLRMRWTWRELEEASTCLAQNYLALGLAPGDRVASLLPNRTVLVIRYIACFKAGLVSVPLNYRYTAPEMDHAMRVSGATLLVAHAERAADIDASGEAGALRCGLVAVEGVIGSCPVIERLIAEPVAAVDLPTLEPDAPAFIVFTSGSTGKPKGATHSLRTFGWIVASITRGMEMTADDVVVPGSSISHTGALKVALAGLAVGAQVAVSRNFDPDEFLPLLREFRPTAAIILPAALVALVRDHGAHAEDFASLRLLICGGDTVTPELAAEFLDLAGLSIDELFGMTEIGTSHLNPPSGPNKSGSVGKLNPSYVASLRDENGLEVLAGIDGRLWMKGPAIMTGYWNNPDATADAMRDGWFNTGDVMMADEDGYFWCRGRKKQMIVHDSSNISPLEVEMAVVAHPAVDLAGVVGVRDAIHGENVWAYVTVRDGHPVPAAQGIIDIARKRVGYKAPEVIAILDRMPLTPTGKVDRKTLKQMAADRLLAEHDAGEPETVME